MDDHKIRKTETLVLSGGGIKGYAMLGSLKKLQDERILCHVGTYIGTSIGALIGASLALGRSAQSTYDMMAQYRYTPNFKFAQLTSTYGLDTGKSLEGLIHLILGSQSYTFERIREIHKTTLIVCATNVSKREPVYFGPDTHPDMDVALALKMSCSIPIYFQSVTYEGDVYVDGCISDNFPFEFKACPNKLGVVFKRSEGAVTSFDSFLDALVGSFAQPKYESSPEILVLESDASAIDFNIPASKRHALFKSGYKQAALYIKKHM